MYNDTPIAVTAMAGIFPGAPDIDRFWKNIVAGFDATAPVPPLRWPVSPAIMVRPGPVPDRAYGDRCCLVDEPDLSLPPAGTVVENYELLDPLHRLVLHTAAGLLGGGRKLFRHRRRTGLVMAAIALPTEGASRLADTIIGNAFEGMVLGRSARLDSEALSRRCTAARVTAYPGVLVSRLLGLEGACFTLDAACASSLYAVKLACDALADRRADAMVAGGVSRPDCLYTQVGFSQLQALSRTGRCSAFDARADGLVVGEGCGLLVLRRLDDALRDGDNVYGVIRGIGLSNDIQGSLLAPAGEGQLRAMAQAYRQAGWSPADVDLIECHGAGTPVGDAVEIESYVRLWQDITWKKGQCAIGSVKTMIGHLLTAAGAAGLIKTLLAMKNHILPPSLHFQKPPADSPLPDSPFRVQSEPAPWQPRSSATPRRAAVSAFGFGGINAHLLLEEWISGGRVRLPGSKSNASGDEAQPVTEVRQPPSVAVIGMGAFFGSLTTLGAFEQAVFKGQPAFSRRPDHRWRGLGDTFGPGLQGFADHGAWIDRFDLDLSEFGTPPREIPEILPQQLLMIRVCAEAMKDAGLPLRGRRPRMGTVIGIAFDMQATDFHLRWGLENRVRQWVRENGLALSDDETKRWLGELQNRLSPALNATRTLGALGSVAASRVAKHFGLGGPSYVVSADASSGLTALEIAVRALQHRELDAALIGAVDLSGDIRNVLIQHRLLGFSPSGHARPFDALADGALPGEGAAALVLKRLDDARADGDRIYGIIRGIGSAGPGPSRELAETYRRSLEITFQYGDIAPRTTGLVEAHASGNPDQDRMEAETLQRFFGRSELASSAALGSVKAVIGHTGAVAGLASVVKACLCLRRELLPPQPGYSAAPDRMWSSDLFHIPVTAQYWTTAGPRRALAAAITPEGYCSHVLLEALETPHEESQNREKHHTLRPIVTTAPGMRQAALFIVDAPGRSELARSVKNLRKNAARWSSDGLSLEAAAARSHVNFRTDPANPVAAAVVATSFDQLLSRLAACENHDRGRPVQGVYVTPEGPLPNGRVALVYPGSGNQYLGMMGRLGVCWPDVFSMLNHGSTNFERQMRPAQTIPRRRDWGPGWEKEAEHELCDPLNVICTQIIFGMAMTQIVHRLGLEPRAAIGYSLGETAALFSLGIWRQRDEMMTRALSGDLFTRQLTAPWLAARRAWKIPPETDFQWTAALVSCPAQEIHRRLSDFPLVRLLIINTSRECVIGGESSQVDGLIAALDCNAIPLKGVTSVHCDAVLPVRKAYRALHLLDTRPVPEIDFYGCGAAGVYVPSRESAADSILEQALHGFDFQGLIRQAYDDGVRFFVEMGPQNSCTRMIDVILDGKPHLAVSASTFGRDECEAVLHLAGELAAFRLPLRLDALYGAPTALPRRETSLPPTATVTLGRTIKVSEELRAPLGEKRPLETPEIGSRQRVSEPPPAESDNDLVGKLASGSRATAEAHRQFLDLSRQTLRTYTENLDLQSRLYTRLLQDGASPDPRLPAEPLPAFSREMCMEFAVGSVARVLGPEFAPVDGYRVRVRLPDEPLMLVDRILTVRGEKASLTSGTVVTEHDVHPDAWYLDGGRAPVCISVEAGQADLFLCAYLGIDLAVRGQRAYRLLDAEVTFHRGLPQPGETIRYEIHIERFVRQGDTWLFFFRFDGSIGDRPLISMRRGCAGFFTADEIEASGGIVTTEEQKQPTAGRRPPDWKMPAPFSEPAACDDNQLAALRRGNLGRAFGSAFSGKRLSPSLRLPGGRMKLIDRVLEMDPRGGRYGLGRIRAEADIHPDDWFLTCHFVDDRVMPGTLMYECCAHTLRVFLQRMGWISSAESACYEPITGIRSRLKCRGPVTPETRRVIYEVEIKELGYGPEPYALADAHMIADDRYIVRFEDMSIKMTGVTRAEVETHWRAAAQVVCDRRQIEEYARGLPSRCFGASYRVFDKERFLARLPSPPFLFVDRVTSAEPPPMELEPGGWIESQHDLSPANWYFSAERTGIMPYSVLLECALQPCGWLAAWLGSALRSEQKLQFRNLGGKAVIHAEVPPQDGLLRMRARLTSVSEAAAMIIEHFDFEVLLDDQPAYSGTTYFGFFTPRALARQKGIADANDRIWPPPEGACRNGDVVDLPAVAPLTPQEAVPWKDDIMKLQLPSRALSMLDHIDCYLPAGGPRGLGYVRGVKNVNPEEWFFQAHFYQDPVWPGSLGIEAFMLLLKYAALQRWPQHAENHRFSLLTGSRHQWIYRGQVTPRARRVEVEAVITRVDEKPQPRMMASGFLKVDGLYIYEMQDFGILLAPAGKTAGIQGDNR